MIAITCAFATWLRCLGYFLPSFLFHDARFHALSFKPGFCHLLKAIVDSFGRVVANAGNDILEACEGNSATLEVLGVLYPVVD